MKELNKNIISVLKNERGFTLLELIFTMTITAIILTGILTIYQINYSLIFNSSEMSKKINKTTYLEQVFNTNMRLIWTSNVSDDGNSLTIDIEEVPSPNVPKKMIMSFDDTTKILNIKIERDGYTDEHNIEDIEKNGTQKVFEKEPNSGDLTVSFLVKDKYGDIPYKKLFKNTNTLYNQTYSIKEIQRIEELLKDNVKSENAPIILSNYGDRMEIGDLTMVFSDSSIKSELQIGSEVKNEEFTNIKKTQEYDVNNNLVLVPVFELNDAATGVRVRFEIVLPDYTEKYDKWFFLQGS